MGMHGRWRRIHTASSQRRRRREWFALDREAQLAGRTVVVGLGDPLSEGRSAAMAITAAVQALLEEQPVAGVEVRHAHVGGAGLIELLSGFERAVLVDCVHVDDIDSRGTVQRIEVWPCGKALDASSAAHAEELRQALRLAVEMGMSVPRPVEIVAIPSPQASSPGAEPAMIPSVAQAIHAWLERPTEPLRVVDRV